MSPDTMYQTKPITTYTCDLCGKLETTDKVQNHEWPSEDSPAGWMSIPVGAPNSLNNYCRDICPSCLRQIEAGLDLLKSGK